MLMTGLLSLNIHDSLTFDGTELCLHPDLFAVSVAAEGGTTSGSQHASTGSGATGTATGSVGIAVGDMIEIRVWDPLPREATGGINRSPPSGPLRTSSMGSANSKLRHTPSASPSTTNTPALQNSNLIPPPASSPGSAPSIPSTSESGNALQIQVPSKIQTTNLRPRAASMANSLQYSVDSDNESENDDAPSATDKSNSTKEDYSNPTLREEQAIGTTNASSSPSMDGTQKSPNSPAKVVTLSASAAAAAAAAASGQGSSLLPPVFPRSRLNSSSTEPMPVATNNNSKPKLITMGRRGKSTATATTSTSASASHHLHRSPKHVFSRHSREISDMTIDTHPLDSMDLLQAAASMDTGEYASMDEDVTNNNLNSTHNLRLSFVLLVTSKTLTTLKGNARTQVSMLRPVADLYSLSSYDTVTVHRIEQEEEKEVLKAVSADFVVVTIKDQYISRGDMVYFQNFLKGSWIYEGERLTEDTKGIKAHASEIRHGNYSAKSGIVTEDTMITFRSRSARIIWLVQLSCEMWDYSSPYENSYQNQPVCEIYFDHWIRFIYKLFTKWKELEVTHSLTVIFFSRTFLTNGQKSSFNLHDVYGRSYEDHFKPVIENETSLHWHSLVVRIKKEFRDYPREVGWSFDRRPSSASQGNILEAINVALNVMQYHFLDRDLHRTGQSVVVVSPGGGVFEVNKGLAEITYQRMMDNGIGSDMLSIGLPPLHIAPFFLYNNDYQSVETHGVDTSETYYEVPHWMHLSFISYDEEADSPEHQEKPKESSAENRKTIGDWLDSYEVTSNGFLRPRIDPDALGTDDNPGNKFSSFSAVGNAAATPGKAKATQERQLISGRNFRDILAACKPRVTGMTISSSLAAILKLQQKESPLKKIMSLHEWGTANFSDLIVPPKSKSSRPDSPNSRRSPLFESLQERSDDTESGSNSSFIGHVDRVLWDQLSSSPSMVSKQTVQLQRSLSMEFEKMTKSLRRLNSDAALTGDSVSISSSNISRGTVGKASIGGDSESLMENETTVSLLSGQDKQIAQLRKMMDAHDARTCARFGSEDDAIREIHVTQIQPSDSELTLSSKGTRLVQNNRRSTNEISPSGGLGAALSQYDGSSPQLESPGDKRLTRTLSAAARAPPTPFQKASTRAASPLLPGMRAQIPERSTRALSPVLLQPISQLQRAEASEDIHEKAQPSQRKVQKEGRLLSRGEVFGSASTLPMFDSFDVGGVTVQPLGTSMTGIEPGRPRRLLTSGSPPVGTGIAGGMRAPKKVMASTSPPRSKIRDRSGQRKGRESSSHSKQPLQSRRQKAFNPFRQSDEDAVLAKRSHNRRRWSHVFPAGEVEFKRHAGPIWNSLTSPAILPLSVDYFPSPHELRDESRFTFSPYSVTLSGIDKSHYSTHDELLMELVRQRVTQDFQIVTAAAVEESKRRAESQRQARSGKPHKMGRSRDAGTSSLPVIKTENSGIDKERYLSMGHRIQVLKYDPSSDTIDIVAYNQRNAYNDPLNIFTYRFLLYSSATKKYTASKQTFKKYTEPYRWSRVDSLISGAEAPRLRDGMRSRRLMFGLIPAASFEDAAAEQYYIYKFCRLLEYLGKIRDKGDTSAPLDVKIGKNEPEREDVLTGRVDTVEAMLRFAVQLRRGKRDPIEWLEIGIDSVFDTRRSYRIIFSWLVASSAKVEAQIQLLHRRCTNFGLRLILFPHTTISRNLYVHAFAVPTLICIRDKEKAAGVEEILKSEGFVYDGIQFTEATSVLECIDNSEAYDFRRMSSGKFCSIQGRQYVHRSGAVFMRALIDRQGWAILAGIENYRHASKENSFREIASKTIRKLSKAFSENF